MEEMVAERDVCRDGVTEEFNQESVLEPYSSSSFRFPTMQLFPLLLDTLTPYNQLEVSPSVYLREMSCSTEERNKQLCRGVRVTQSLEGYSTPPATFKVSPCVVLFHNIQLHSSSSLTLTVTNSSKVSQRLKIVSEDDPNIRVICKYSKGCKLAAGMTAKYIVEFSPTLNKCDYFHNITFSTDHDETFLVPVIGLSARQFLDLPDSIELPIALVKVESKKTLVVRNIGCCPAAANFFTELPFKVDPEKIYLQPEEIGTITLSFCTPHLGTWKNKMIVLFESGERLVINLEGSSEEGNVYLSCSRVDIAETFIKTKRQSQVTIHNSTHSVLSFQWHLLSSLDEDYQVLDKLKAIYSNCAEMESKKVNKLVYFDLYDDEVNRAVCERVTRDNISLATSDSLYFHHSNFCLTPIRGEVWPGGICKCTIVFHPEKIGRLETFAFLEVGGQVSRIPLALSATAVGPKIRLDTDSVDVGRIHLMQVVSIRILLENVGDVEGEVCFAQTLSKWDSQSIVSCYPLCTKLEPDERRPCLVSISRSSPGIFSLPVSFQVEQSSLVLTCNIVGEVLNPPVQFNETILDFGSVPLGFEMTKWIKLVNSCEEPFGFSLSVSGFWDMNAVRALDHKPIPLHPKQFSLYPSEGFIKPYQQLDIKVVGLMNSKNCGDISVVLSVWDYRMDSSSIPIIYCASCPALRSLTPQIVVDFALINYPYSRQLILTNDTDSSAFYTVHFEKCDDGIECSMDMSEGVVMPYGLITINLLLSVTELNDHHGKIILKYFGLKKTVEVCLVTMRGLPPVLNVEPKELDFGDIILLVPSTKSISLINVSPTPCEYSLTLNDMEDRRGVEWSMSDSGNGDVVDGNSQVHVEITVVLREALLVRSTLQVSAVQGGCCISVSLSANGIGSAIITVPPLCPSFDFGHLLCCVDHEIELMIINQSCTVQEVMWSTCESFKPVSNCSNQGVYFKILPYRLTLKPGQMDKVKVTAFCDEEKIVKEHYYFFSIAGGQTTRCKKLVGESLLTASFLSPALKLSTDNINFSVKVSSTDPFPQPPTEHLTLSCDFSEEMEVEMCIKPPFKMVRSDGVLVEKDKVIMKKELAALDITVMFDTLFTTDIHSWSADSTLLLSFSNHPSKALVHIHGEVLYPNVTLNSHLIDFGGVKKYCESYREIIMENRSPFDLHYSFHWSNQLSVTPISDQQNAPHHVSPSEEEESNFDLREECSILKVSTLTDELTHDEFLDDYNSLDLDLLVRQALIQFQAHSQSFISSKSEYIEEEIQSCVELADIFLNNMSLFDKLSSLFTPNLPDNAMEEEKLFVTPNDLIPGIVDALVKIHGDMVREETKMRFHEALLPFITRFLEEKMFHLVSAVLPPFTYSSKPTHVYEMIDLIPKSGILLVGQQQVIGAVFKSEEEVQVEAVALCTIRGGPTEKILFKAVCTQPKYSFETTIQFGIIPFCEVSTLDWKVSNDCAMDLAFRVLKMNHSDQKIFSVHPNEGYLVANSTLVLSVTCIPLAIGPISTFFHIELGGDLEVVEVKVEGLSVMCQVMLLDVEGGGCDAKLLPTEDCYKSVADLTHEAFHTLLLTRDSISSSEHKMITSALLHQNPSLEDWVIVLANQEGIPSENDLRASCERLLMNNLILSNENWVRSHALSNKKYITDCLLQPYIIEFGPVLVGHEEVRTVDLLNHGLVPCDLRLCFPNTEEDLKSHGLSVSLTNSNIDPQNISRLTLTLAPSLQLYQGTFFTFSLQFVIQVCCGPTLLVQVKALIVEPELSLKNSVLEFGDVKCSNIKSLPLTITNISCVDVEWKVKLLPVKRVVNRVNINQISDQLNHTLVPFEYNLETGFLSSGESVTIVITFQPFTKGVCERLLMVQPLRSRSTLSCLLRGTGSEPHLVPTHTLVEFGIVSPYSSIYEMDLYFFNPCTFPIELVLEDYDSVLEQETRVLKAVSYLQSSVGRTYLPLKYFDTKLSPKLFELYRFLACLGINLSKLNAKESDDDSKLGKKNRFSVTSRKGKALGVGIRSRRKSLNKPGGSRKSIILAASGENDSITSEMDRLLADKTPQEIDILVHESIGYIRNIFETGMGHDYTVLLNKLAALSLNETLNNVILEIMNPSISSLSAMLQDQLKLSISSQHTSPDPFCNGTLVLFHGAPFTDHAYVGQKTAKELGIKAVSLDSIIVEEAALSHGSSAVYVRDAVNSAYLSTLNDRPSKTKSTSSRGYLSHSDEFNSETERLSIIDPVEDLQSKVDAVMNFVEEERNMKKKMEELEREALKEAAASKAHKKISDRKSKIAGETPNVTKHPKRSAKEQASAVTHKKNLLVDMEDKSEIFLNIPLEVIADLISNRLKTMISEIGILVDSLTGIFVKRASKCLEMLLNSAENTRNIMMVHLHNSYESHITLKENQKSQHDKEIFCKAVEVVETLKNEEVDLDFLSASSEYREKCRNAMDLILDSAVKLREQALTESQRKLAETMMNLEDQSGVGPHKMKTKGKQSRGTKSTVTSNSSKSKKSKKMETAVEQEPVISDEELELMKMFQSYEEKFAEMFSILAKHNRIKTNAEDNVTLRSSRKGGSKGLKTLVQNSTQGGGSKSTAGGTREKSMSRLSSTSHSSRLKSSSLKTNLNSMHSSFTKALFEEAAGPGVGVPIIILNYSNITTELKFHDLVQGVISLLLPVLTPQTNITLNNKSVSSEEQLTMSVESNKKFWCFEPDLFSKVPVNPCFRIDNKLLVSSTYSFTADLISDSSCLDVRFKDHLEKIGESKVCRFEPMLSFPSLTCNPNNLFRKSKDIVNAQNELTTRLVLGAGEGVGWTVSFYPSAVGHQTQDLRLRISGWPYSSLSVKLQAVVELPDIKRDPEHIFTKVQNENKTADYPMFIKSDGCFDFGNVFHYGKCSSSNNSPSFVNTKMKFSNITHLPIEIEFYLMSGVHFRLETDKMSLMEGQSNTLLLHCCPQSLGPHTDKLVCCIVDNPEPLTFQIQCTCVKAEVKLSHKDLIYGKVLVNKTSSKSLLLTNNCPLNLYWCFQPHQEISELVVCSPACGLLAASEKALINFRYMAQNVEIIDSFYTLEIYDRDSKKGGILMQSISIPLKVESYDIIVDLSFKNSDSKCALFYGNIKVDNDSSQNFDLLNQGNYDILFRVELEDLPLMASYSLKDIFTVTPFEGILPSRNKLMANTSIKVTVRCIDELKLEEAPVLRVELFTGIGSSLTHVANLSVPVTLQSHYTKFNLIPKEEVGFGCLMVGETKSMVLTIENTGIFDFNFKILSQNDLALSLENSIAQQGDEKASAAKSGSNFTVDRTSNKTSDSKIKKQTSDKKHVGIFTIYTSSGNVKMNSSVKIKIYCTPTEEDNYREVILVQASELPSAIRFGIPVTLVATGCLPSINFKDTSVIFKDAVIVQDFNTSHDDQGLPTVYYSSDEGLWFKNVVVSTSKELKVYLPNSNMVASTVKIMCSSDAVFSVSPKLIHILPYTRESFTLTFSPKSIQTEECIVKMELVLASSSHKSSSIKENIKVKGEGCLPLVQVTCPLILKNKPGISSLTLDMGTCLLDFHLSTILTFTNNSQCQAKFIVEMISGIINYFSFAPLPDCNHLVKDLHSSESKRLTCSLGPNEHLELSCVFAPVTTGVCTASLQVDIVDNPFEQINIFLTGRGHTDSLTIQGLPLILDSALPMKSSFLSNKGVKNVVKGNLSSCSYLLDFGGVYVDRPIKREMQLRNREEWWMKCSWEVSQNLSSTYTGLINFYPEVAHIPPNSTLTVYALLLPNKSMTVNKMLIKCSVENITLADKYNADDWNSHQKMTAWLRHEPTILKRYNTYCNVGDNMETEPEIIESIKVNEVKVFVQLEADKPMLTSATEELVFSDTLICQGSSKTLVVTNRSKVEVNFNTNFVITKAQPTSHSLSKVSQPVFSCGRLVGNILYPETGIGLHLSPPSTASSITKLYINQVDIEKRLVGTKRKDDERTMKYYLQPSTDQRKRVRYLDSEEKDLKGCPFFVDPQSASLAPGAELTLTVHFLPTQMFTYSAKLNFILEGVNDESSGLSVDLMGVSLTSYCHLEVDNIDYAPSSTNSLSTTTSSNPTKAIMIDCIGVPASCNKKFGVINPTDMSYQFDWIKLNSGSTEDEDTSELLCLTPSGTIQAHKTYDMEFSLFSGVAGRFINRWMLRISDMDMELDVVFISSVREPQLSFSPPHLTLQPTIAGVVTCGEVRLVNNEEMEFKFNVESSSLFSEGRMNSLLVEPLCGLLPPSSSFPFSVKLTPKAAGETVFLVRVYMSKKKNPLCFKVSSHCYSIEADIYCWPEGSNNKIRLVHYSSASASSNYNQLNLGHMELRVPKRVNIMINNTGEAAFYTQLSKREEAAWKKSGIQVDFGENSTTELISPGSSMTLVITFLALTKASFNKLSLIIKIVKGPEYVIHLSGDASCPEYSFSFTHYDFGPRFVQTGDVCYNSVELIFSNQDEISLELEKVFKDNCDVLKVELEHCVVPPRSELVIVVNLFPRQLTTISQDVEFLVNGIYRHIINFTATGIPFKVELVKTKDKLISFGGVKLGDTASRCVELINRSQKSVRVSLKDSSHCSSILIKPRELSMSINKVSKFTISFTPLNRGVDFVSKVLLECEEVRTPIVVVEGRGVAPEFRLDRDIIPFGLTVVGCSNTIKLALINSGDFGARFEWDMRKASDCFNISPISGYSTVGSTQTFDVTFSPKCNHKSVRNQVSCLIENYKTPLNLVISGTCAEVPPPKDTVKFFSPVRQTDTKSIILSNDSVEKWVIYPLVSGEYFNGNEMLTVMPKSFSTYIVTYHPLTMTTKKSNHEGSVLFLLPDGQNIIYNLKGVANSPVKDESVTWKTPAKYNFIGQIPITNWLPNQSQRFTVTIKSLDKMKSMRKDLFKIYGNSQIEVAPSSTRMYDIHFFSYIPSHLNFVVNYVNEKGGEYGWMDLNIAVIESNILETYRLETRVRTMVKLPITITNPLETKLILSWKPLHRVTIDSPPIPSKSKGVVTLSYLPVVEEEESEVVVVMKSTNLGRFCYRLLLTATPPIIPPPVVMETCLGRTSQLTLPIENLTHEKAVFNIMTDSKSLICDKNMMLEAKSKNSLTVTHEPFSEEGETTMVIATSPTAGIFSFPVKLRGLTPMPQGPFRVESGETISLYFKNVFLETKEFLASVDQPTIFSIKHPKRHLKSKEETEFIVSMKKMDDVVEFKDLPVASKVMISSSFPAVTWVYYVMGSTK